MVEIVKVVENKINFLGGPFLEGRVGKGKQSINSTWPKGKSLDPDVTNPSIMYSHLK